MEEQFEIDATVTTVSLKFSPDLWRSERARCLREVHPLVGTSSDSPRNIKLIYRGKKDFRGVARNTLV